MIETSWLLTFASFAEDTNMSRAAKRLHLTQPAVHGHVKKLEDDLGVPLYRREGRGLVLTEEGVEVAAFARDLVERTSELRATLARGPVADEVVLAAGPGAIRYVVGDALPSFQRQTKSRISVRALESTAALAAVRSGEAHVGVGVLTEPPGDLMIHPLVSIEQVLVLPRKHALASRRSVRLAALAGERWVLPPAGAPQHEAITYALRERGIEPIIGAVGRGWELTIKLVELGLGVGVVNGFCEVPRSLVKRSLPDLPRVPYFAFTRERPRPRARALLEALISAARAASTEWALS